MNNKFRGCLIGGAIGDALGYQIEFKKNIKNREVTKYLNDKGIISDDTQMTLFTANGLLWRETRLAMKGVAPKLEDAVYYAYLDWLETQDKYKIIHNKVTWLKDIKELNIERAPGITCVGVLSSGKCGSLKYQINDSKGCGGVMRVAPLGLSARTPKLAGEYGAKIAAITHGHVYSSLSSFLFSAIINIITYTQKTLEAAIKESIEHMKSFCNENKLCSKKELKNFLEIIQNAISLSIKNLDDIKAIKMIGEGWVAEESLAIALYSCLKYSNSFESAIVCAVNHDGDSDSTGAIAGNIIGTYLGYEKIPNYYIKNIELKEVILEIADDLSQPIPVSEYNCDNDENWLSKYLLCQRMTKDTK